MNWPPKMKAARRDPSGFQDNTDDCKEDITLAPWHVLVNGRRRDQLWGRYASRAGAEATVRELRKHGFVARAEGPQ